MRFLTKWLILIFTLALLNACGGGSDEPSNLFDDTGGDVGGKPIDTSNDITDITMFPGIGPRLVESGGRTTISFRTIGSTGSRAGEVAPNIPLNVTLYPKGVAKLENVPASSDHKADFSFSVSHPGSGTVSVNISGGNGINGGFELPIYFGASVAAEIISGDNIAPADGVTPTDIEIIARDAYGNGIPNISVGFVFPLDSFAVPNAITATNEFGATVIGITNTVPQRTKTT
ncbi:MAG: Ig-like domain-containing protein, partial [Candidatus Marithrix sp.]|nr:Ig-like domain-containing protein [Candidatus Marithrix sp.]